MLVQFCRRPGICFSCLMSFCFPSFYSLCFERASPRHPLYPSASLWWIPLCKLLASSFYMSAFYPIFKSCSCYELSLASDKILSWNKLQLCYSKGFPDSSVVNLLAIQETQETLVRSLGREDPLKRGMATYSSILAWRIPWTEEPGRLQSIGSQKAGHDGIDLACMPTCAIHLLVSDSILSSL